MNDECEHSAFIILHSSFGRAPQFLRLKMLTMVGSPGLIGRAQRPQYQTSRCAAGTSTRCATFSSRAAHEYTVTALTQYLDPIALFAQPKPGDKLLIALRVLGAQICQMA